MLRLPRTPRRAEKSRALRWEAAVGTTGRWFFLLVIVATAALGTLFTVQNLERVTDLSLNLWVVAFALKTPQPIPYLLWGAFGSGLLIAGSVGIVQRGALQRKIRSLEQDAVRAGSQSTGDGWS